MGSVTDRINAARSDVLCPKFNGSSACSCLKSGHRLVIVQQPGGGSQVEITPFEGGQTLRTLTYQSAKEAISEAQSIVDKSTPAGSTSG